MVDFSQLASSDTFQFLLRLFFFSFGLAVSGYTVLAFIAFLIGRIVAFFNALTR